MSGVRCINGELHSTSLKTLTECQTICRQRDDCIGVAFSSTIVHSGNSGSSNCYFCPDSVEHGNEYFDMHMKGSS